MKINILNFYIKVEENCKQIIIRGAMVQGYERLLWAKLTPIKWW